MGRHVGSAGPGRRIIDHAEVRGVTPESSTPVMARWSVAHKLIASHLVGGQTVPGAYVMRLVLMHSLANNECIEFIIKR